MKRIRLELLGMTGFLVAVSVFILFHSPSIQLYVGHDVSLVIDGSWRLDNGQVPHQDFPSILGYGYLLQQHFFLKLFHYHFIAFAVSSIVTAILCFLYFLTFYRSRYFLHSTTAFIRAFLFLLLVVLVLGQYHFGMKHTLTTYANLYNRYCFAVMLLIFIQLFVWSRDPGKPHIAQIIIVALLLNYLFFVKLTYVVIIAGMIGLLWLMKMLSLRTVILTVGVTLGIFAAIWLVTDVDPFAILRDYKTISQARSKVLLQRNFIYSKLFQYYNLFFLAGAFLLLAQVLLRRIGWKVALLIVYLCASALILQFTNWGTTDIVLLNFLPALMVLIPASSSMVSFRILMLLSCFFFFKNLRSIYYLTKSPQQSYSELKSPYLRGFFTDFEEVKCRENYAVKVMQGVELVNQNKSNGDKVMAFTFDNPFPFLTQTAPPRNVPIVWQFETTYSYEVFPPPQVLFSDVSLVLTPVCTKAESATEMLHLYGAILQTSFTPIARNEFWILFEKK